MYFFFILHQFTVQKFVLAIQPANLNNHFFYFNHMHKFKISLMERTSRILLGLEALTATILLGFGAIHTVNRDFLNTNTAVTRQLIRTERTLQAASLPGRVGSGTKVNESSTLRFWAAGFQHVTARSVMARVLKLFFFHFLIFFGSR